MDSEDLPRTEPDLPVEPLLDRRIGPYELLRELGHGGMGVVYLAARADEQYDKRVALKVIKSGVDRADVVRHFRRERQILAGLEHPNIARFLDGGATDDGLPYFVMEFVEGERIDDYCDRSSLSTLARLNLFRSVCSALEYAHRNLIVHRDLKPGNVLVTSEGTPKLLDFGIARFLDPDLTGPTATATALAMTPEYASPEQARGEMATTASDVYSLGIMLYELLTGQLPYRLKTHAPLEVLRAVCDEAPEKPSTAVGRTTEDMGRTREGSVDRLRRRLRGDLDTILLKALQKEPSQRYPSVEAFSEDLGRFVDGRPIKARKPTLAYRARKFVGRHWAGVAAAALAALLIVGFSLSTYVQSARVAKERDKAQRVSAFMVDLFKVSDPGEARGNTVTAREILDRGAERIRAELKGDPEVRATLLDTMGNVYKSLGLYEKAEGLLREAVDSRRRVLGEHPDLAASLNGLGNVIERRGDYAGAEALYREALSMRRRLLGPEHPDVAKTLNNLAIVLDDKGEYAAAEALYREALALGRKRLGNDHIQVAQVLNNLAVTLNEEGDSAAAESILRETLEIKRKRLGSDHPDVSLAMSNLAVVRSEIGDQAGAEALFRETLALEHRLHGDRHPAVAYALDGLGRTLIRKGDPGSAEPVLREALSMAEDAMGREQPEIAVFQAGLAEALRAQHKLAEAEACERSALATARRLFPKDHVSSAAPLTGLGEVLVDMGHPAAAEALFREALAIRRKALPAEHPDTAETESGLGGCLAAQGRYAESEPLLLRSYATLKARRTERSYEARRALARIVGLYEAWDKPDQARGYAAVLAKGEAPSRDAAAPGRSPGPGP